MPKIRVEESEAFDAYECKGLQFNDFEREKSTLTAKEARIGKYLARGWRPFGIERRHDSTIFWVYRRKTTRVTVTPDQ